MKKLISPMAAKLPFAIAVAVLGGPVQQSVASVYQQQALSESVTAAIDQLLIERPGGDRQYMLNGHRLAGRLAHSKATPRELLAHLMANWESANKQGSTIRTRSADNLRKPLHSAADNWAMFANLKLFPNQNAGNSPFLQDKYIVFAMLASDDSMTDVWTYHIPQELDPLTLFRRPESASTFPPYPGSIMRWSMVEATDSYESELYIMQAQSGVQQQSKHYLNSFREQGYRLDQVPGTESNSNAQLLLSKNGGSVSITIKPTSLNNPTLLCIVQIKTVR
jgi:hypothetical protein